MEQFGLEPLTLRIVSAQPTASARPRTMSKVPSIRIEITGEDRTFYKVALHNLSKQAVMAVYLDMPGQNGSSGQTAEGHGSHEVTALGAIYQCQFGIPHGGRVSNGIFVEDSPPPLMVLEAALFKDGSYEGDMQIAAQLVANRIGFEIQQQRVDRLFAGILADVQSDDDADAQAKVARIRSGIAQLTEDPDLPMVETVQAQFPGLSGQAPEQVKTWLKSGIDEANQMARRRLRELERPAKP
jgi:hypothetical protein